MELFHCGCGFVLFCFVLFLFTCCRKRTDALEAVPLLSATSPFIQCAQSQPQPPSVTMMMLLLHPQPLVSLLIRARDHSSSTADDVGRQADAFRSAAMLLLLQAALDCISHDNCTFPPTNRCHKLSLIATMRRMWLLDYAIGAQAPPPPSAFNSGPDREFEFLALRLGLSTDTRARIDAQGACFDAAPSAWLQLSSALDAVYGAGRPSSTRMQLYWPIGPPLQPSLHPPPEFFSDLLVACIARCGCDMEHGAAALCL